MFRSVSLLYICEVGTYILHDFLIPNHVMICNLSFLSLAQNPFLDELFETMQTFCNIFIIKAEHLSQVCSEEPYVSCKQTSKLLEHNV